MRYSGTLIAVKDLKKSADFYTEIMGLGVVCDFGDRIVLSDGLVLQSAEERLKTVGLKRLTVGSSTELYFEETDFDGFLKKLKTAKIKRSLKEESWGQRKARFTDADGHRIEVGENLVAVVKRLKNSGMTEREIALKMDVPVSYVSGALQAN